MYALDQRNRHGCAPSLSRLPPCCLPPACALQMAVLFPRAYVAWREPLCVLSHVTHKLAQLAVTLVPPVGIVFSGKGRTQHRH